MDDRITCLLDQHISLVLEANETTNITRITSNQEAQVLHTEDSLAGLPEVNAAPSGRLGDMGSGAGFPGIPLAIVTGRETVLIESIKKKAAVLQNCIEKLRLHEQVSVFSGRVEELALASPCSFSVLTARALSQLPSLMELASPLLELGGHLICYKAHIDDDEFDHARTLERKLGLALKSDRSFYLSDGVTFRRIVVFEKIGSAEVSLPRRPGMAQKRPY